MISIAGWNQKYHRSKQHLKRVKGPISFSAIFKKSENTVLGTHGIYILETPNLFKVTLDLISLKSLLKNRYAKIMNDKSNLISKEFYKVIMSGVPR